MSVTDIHKAHEYREQRNDSNRKSHQLENGYAPVANEIIRDLRTSKLTKRDLQVVWFVIEMTYGWQKKFAQITVKDIADANDIEYSACARSVRKLINSNVLIRAYDEQKNVWFGYQKYAEKWGDLAPEKSKKTGVQNEPPSGQNEPPTGVQNEPPTGVQNEPPLFIRHISNTVNTKDIKGSTPENNDSTEPPKPPPVPPPKPPDLELKQTELIDVSFWDQLPSDLQTQMLARNSNAKAFAERYPDLGFLRFATDYPQRDGNQRWQMAKSAYNARRKEGFTDQQILEATQRYKRYCDAHHSTNTPMVKQAATFLGDPENLEINWSIDNAKSQRPNSKSTNPAFDNRKRDYSTSGTPYEKLPQWAKDAVDSVRQPR